MPYIHAPVAVRPPSPELSPEDQKSLKRFNGLRMLCDSVQNHNNKFWNDKKRPRFAYEKNGQILIDLIYTLNYKRVYAEHKLYMGKYNWRSRIAEVEGHGILQYSNDPAPASAHHLNGWLPRPETSERALSAKDVGPPSGVFKRVKLPPFQVLAAAEELRSARYRLEDTLDALNQNHERRRAAAVKGYHGRVPEMRKLYQPSNDRNRSPALPRRGWMWYCDARSPTTHVVDSSRLCFELKEDGSVVKVPAKQLTPLEAFAEKQKKLVDAGIDAYNLLFEKHWEHELDARTKEEELRLRPSIPNAPMSPPPSPPVSRKSSPIKSKQSVKSASPTKSKAKSPTKPQKVESAFEMGKPTLTVSEILSQRAKEQRHRARQGQGNGLGQQQVSDIEQQAQLGQSSLNTGSGRERQQKRQVSPQKGERGRARMVAQWQEDSMKTVRREISP